MAISLQPHPYEDTFNAHGRFKTPDFLHKSLKTQENHHLPFIFFDLFLNFSLAIFVFRVYLSSRSSIVQSTFQSINMFYIKKIVFFYKKCLWSLVIIKWFVRCSWSLDVDCLCESRNSGSSPFLRSVIFQQACLDHFHHLPRTRFWSDSKSCIIWLLYIEIW